MVDYPAGGCGTILMVMAIAIINLTPTMVQCAGVSRKAGSSISCFSCNSRNDSDIHCHDPFNPAMSKYVENCKVPKQNHIGVFPAKFCVKVVGKTVSTGESLVIRACSLQNMDNQCGNFKFEGNLYKGCILTCDFDGCNRGHYVQQKKSFLFIIIIIIMAFSINLAMTFHL